MQSPTIWQRMLSIDRRLLYLLLFVNIIVFLIAPIRMPASISPPVQKFYDEIEKLKPGDLVMISSNWSASTLAENQPQLEAVLIHLMRKKARFTFISIEAQSRDISYRLAERLTKTHGYEYGKDWAHFGFVPNLIVAIKGMVNDLPATIKEDVRGTPISQLEVVKGVKSLKDYKMIIDVTPSGTVPIWISYSPKGIPILYCPTSVMAAEAYTYLDSGQITGMITGAKGAQEYEQLLKIEGLGARFANAISFSHVLIIVFILLGNFAMFMNRAQARREA
ncbi:MAG: hypothetical protein KatS3mg016_1957 [Fimbriimonadales bacterium]|nr:MAG: hypothetical protein KatS3mg016_1957 [Fimbriimonadales bacterium]